MAEATSRHERPTAYGRGTASYRAPEILSESRTYSKKTDIWALGCILYELVTYEKAFRGDWEVLEYKHEKQRLEIKTTIPQSWRFPAKEMIHDLLEIEWQKRPCARKVFTYCFRFTGLCRPFKYEWQFQHRLAALYSKEGERAREELARKNLIPLFVREMEEGYLRGDGKSFDVVACWAKLEKKLPIFRGARQQLLDGRFGVTTPSASELTDSDWSSHEYSALLYKKIEEDTDCTIALWREGVRGRSDDAVLVDRLRQAYAEKGDPELAIAGWLGLVDCHPGEEQFLRCLMEAFEWKGDLYLAAAVWMELIARHPARTGLRVQLARICEVLGDMQGSLLLYTQLVYRHPSWPSFQIHLAESLRQCESRNTAIETWKHLLKKYPEEPLFVQQLISELTKSDDHSLSISIWEELSAAYPGVPVFLARLAMEHENKGHHYIALGIWKKLVSRDPSIEWQDALDASCKRVGEQSFAEDIWREMADAHPTNTLLRARSEKAKLGRRWESKLGRQCESSGNEVESESTGDGEGRGTDKEDDLEWYPGDDALAKPAKLVVPKRSLSRRMRESFRRVMGRER